MLDAYGRLKYFYRRRLKSNRPANPPDDVKDLFEEYQDSTKRRMYEEKLSEYLKVHQGIATNDAKKKAQKIIASFKGFMNYHRSSISEKGFFKYLLSEENHPLVEKKMQAFDGNAKLAHYFVYTSHCSYLKQNKTNKHNITAEKLKKTMPFVESLQKGISGESKSKSVGDPSNKNTTDHRKEHKTFHSSTTAIAKALKNGVRVIELDLSICSKKNDIKVTLSHPRIKHPSVSLTKCMEIINEKAFETSKYPLMIILVQNFVSDQSNVQFPQDMIKRIHDFKWKHKQCRLKEAFEASSLESLKEKLIILTRQQMNHEPSSTNTNDKEDNIYDFGERNESFGVEKLTENNIELAASTYYTRLRMKALGLTQEKILAVYPNLDPNDITNNFDPLIGWTRGAQMVAINPQNFDKHLWVVQGLFRAHVAQQRKDSKEPTPTGYVKKPNILLNQSFNPTEWRPVKKILKVKVYLGTGWHLDFSSEDFDDKSPPDFFTAVEIVGVPVDEAREKTVPVMDDWVPVWNQEFEFPLTVPELAMLVIEVKEFDTDRTHDFGGQTCLPVWLIRSGIRSVPLYDKKGKPYKSARLLMRFKFN